MNKRVKKKRQKQATLIALNIFFDHLPEILDQINDGVTIGSFTFMSPKGSIEWEGHKLENDE